MGFDTTQTFCNIVSHNEWDFIKHPSLPQCNGLKANIYSHYIHSTALKMSLFPYRSGAFAATFFIIMFIISINFHFSRHPRGTADAFQHLQGKLAMIAFSTIEAPSVLGWCEAQQTLMIPQSGTKELHQPDFSRIPFSNRSLTQD